MKTIRSAQDLAINGADPAFHEPLHVGRPNLGQKRLFQVYVDQIFENNWLTNNGPLVQQFEHRIAELHEVKHCIAMCNGTVALEIAIRALGLQGEVILPSYTFIATAHALHWQAITPVFADISPGTHLLCPESVASLITPRTTGIIGVHLWGRVAPAEQLQQLADRHGLHLMFDAAHAFYCGSKGVKVGNFGACEVLSFHATKFINSFEGGAVLTNDDTLAEKMRLMRNFGFAGRDNVIYPGTNGKMAEISAAMGLVNLESMEDILAHNKSNYLLYRELLAEAPGVDLLSYHVHDDNNYQYIVVEISDQSQLGRDEILAALEAENILARRYFWPGCHRMKPFQELFPHAGLILSNTEDVAGRVLVLPTGSSINGEHIECTCAVIRQLAGG